MANIVNLQVETFTFEETNATKTARPIEYFINENGCHICGNHSVDKDNYPRVFRGKDLRMSRYVWETVNKREIPKGLLILHKCDNPECINPAHLHLGTQKENMAEMVRRGRSARGSKHPKAKLDERDVYFIRFLSEDLSHKELADRFGVRKDHIKALRKGKGWKHVTKDMTELARNQNLSA